jgi:hypothetical protein
MLLIGETLVSTDVIEKHFVCDLEKCKGACCVQGDSGAPLGQDELEEVEKAAPQIRDMLTDEGRESLDRYGYHVQDSDGDFVTPLVKGYRECAYTIFENGVASCAFEKAYMEGKITFRKPVSCHLYPIRIKKMAHYEAVNYDRWDICKAACSLGEKLQVPVYRFLKDALVRRYGEVWYAELEEVATAYLDAKSQGEE